MIKVQNVKNYSVRQTDRRQMKLRSNSNGCELIKTFHLLAKRLFIIFRIF